MKDVWAWVFAVVIALCILTLVAYGRSERRAYWAARGAAIRVMQAEEAPRAPRIVEPETRLWSGR